MIAKATSGHGGQVALAKRLGIRKSVVNGWLAGSGGQQAELIAKAVSACGGDIHRALPEYEGSGREEPLQIVGSVTGNSSRFSSDDRGEMTNLTSLLKSSPLHRLTHGPVVLLLVDGDSMEPDFPNGSFLMCRRPNDPFKLPPNTPAIIRRADTNESTFKMLQLSGDMANAVPVNVKAHPILSFPAKELIVDYVALGHFTPHAPTVFRQKSNGSNALQMILE